MNIEAIKARYQQHLFRSRTEARWAVFFDQMQISWEYEPEGFVLEGGTPYLPDFWLQDFGLFVEIKGFLPTGNELKKCKVLQEGTGRGVVLFRGIPGARHGIPFLWDTTDSSGGTYGGDDCYFMICNGHLCLVVEDMRGDRQMYVTDTFESNWRVITATEAIDRGTSNYDRDVLETAYLTAKSKRFW